jgi:hypothetical protein
LDAVLGLVSVDGHPEDCPVVFKVAVAADEKVFPQRALSVPATVNGDQNFRVPCVGSENRHPLRQFLLVVGR